MAVAVPEAPKSTAEMPVAAHAFYSYAFHVLDTLHRHEQAGHSVLNNKILIPVVVGLALALGGCSAIDANEIAAYQASVSGLPNGAVALGAQGGDYYFTLTHATDSAVQKATDAGASTTEIDDVLKRIDRKVNAYAQGPLTVELACNQGGTKTQSNCDLKVHPTGDGAGKVVFQETECTVNPYSNQTVCARPLEYVFNVDSHITPPVLNMGFQLSPDGKTMQVIGTAKDPAGIKADSVSVATCSDKKPLPVSGTTDHAAASVTLKPGENCYVFSANDTRGNHAEIIGKYGYQFDLGITSNPVLDADGKINITGAVANNTFKVGTVTLDHCGDLAGDQDLAGVAQVKPDGTFAGKIKPVVGDNDCVEAIATDGQGIQVISQNRNHIAYQLNPGLVAPLRDPNNPQLWYLLGNPPSNMDNESVRAAGSQPMWKQLGTTGSFTCDHLPGGAKIGDQTFTYALRCALPSSAGQALVTFNIYDKNGYGMSATYNLPMPENPRPGELFDYFGPPLIASLLLATALTGGGLYVRESMKRNKAIDSVRETYKRGDFIGAANLLSASRIGKDLKTSLHGEIIQAECATAQDSLRQSLAMRASGYMNGHLAHVIKDTDQLNFLLAQEQFGLDQSIPRAFFEHLHRWTERSLHPVPTPASWRDLEAGLYTQAQDSYTMLRHLTRVMTQNRYSRIREEMARYDKAAARKDKADEHTGLMEQVQETVLMHELTAGSLFKGDIFRPLVIQGMGVEEATRIMWKWGNYEAINGPLKRMAAKYGQPEAVEKAIKIITRI